MCRSGFLDARIAGLGDEGPNEADAGGRVLHVVDDEVIRLPEAGGDFGQDEAAVAWAAVLVTDR